MYKTEFFKTCYNGRENGEIVYKFIKANGWAELFETPAGELIEIVLHKDTQEGYWHSSETTTGLSISRTGRTRADVLEQITPEFLSIISEALKKPVNIKLKNKLADFILSEGAVTCI